jgi:2-phospho-L-lactate guanylyltransferase
MKLDVLLPVKPFHLAKSRLADTLSPAAREALVRDGLRHTLDVLREVQQVGHTLVISADPLVWEIALSYGVDILEEVDVPGLNESLALGLRSLQQHGAEAVMILPVDLPRLNAQNLQGKINKLVSPGMVIVPDRHGDGTNLLLFAPPDLVPTAFGAGSFERHCALAQAAGVAPLILRCPDLGLDIDSPEDLALLAG